MSRIAARSRYRHECPEWAVRPAWCADVSVVNGAGAVCVSTGGAHGGATADVLLALRYAAFCPFCGERLGEAEGPDGAAAVAVEPAAGESGPEESRSRTRAGEPEERRCAYCGEIFVRAPGSHQRYCCAECRERASRDRRPRLARNAKVDRYICRSREVFEENAAMRREIARRSRGA